MIEVTSIKINGVEYFPVYSHVRACTGCDLYEDCLKVHTNQAFENDICDIFREKCILKKEKP